MKFIYPILVLLLLTSCAPITFYQLIETEGIGLKNETDNLVFENDEIKVFYNLWSENGNPGFVFYNKTDSDIIINKRECYFIINGISYDYFQNRSYTFSNSVESISTNSTNSFNIKNSQNGSISLKDNNVGYNSSRTNGNYSSSSKIVGNSASNSQSLGHSKGTAVTYNEDSIVKVPSKTSKVIVEFNVTQNYIQNCEIDLTPNSSKIKRATFTKENSPLVFSNRISYQLLNQENSKKEIENQFFVNRLSNYGPQYFFSLESPANCGVKTLQQQKVFRYAKPNSFFIEFTN